MWATRVIIFICVIANAVNFIGTEDPTTAAPGNATAAEAAASAGDATGAASDAGGAAAAGAAAAAGNGTDEGASEASSGKTAAGATTVAGGKEEKSSVDEGDATTPGKESGGGNEKGDGNENSTTGARTLSPEDQALCPGKNKSTGTGKKKAKPKLQDETCLTFPLFHLNREKRAICYNDFFYTWDNTL